MFDRKYCEYCSDPSCDGSCDPDKPQRAPESSDEWFARISRPIWEQFDLRNEAENE
jgi:hypothetical protein